VVPKKEPIFCLFFYNYQLIKVKILETEDQENKKSGR